MKVIYYGIEIVAIIAGARLFAPLNLFNSTKYNPDKYPGHLKMFLRLIGVAECFMIMYAIGGKL